MILDPCPQLSKTLLIFICTHLAVIIYLLSPYINWWRTDFFRILNHEVDLPCLKKVRKGTWSQDARVWTSMACPGGCDPQGWGGEESPRLGRARPPADLSASGSPGERQWHVWRGQETWFLVPSPKFSPPHQLLNPSHCCFVWGKTWWCRKVPS